MEKFADKKEKIDLHADDFGYSINTSKDILDCIVIGDLDSISIMSNMSSFAYSSKLLLDSIPKMKKLPKMSTHINLIEGYKTDGSLMDYSWGKLFFLSFTKNKKEKELIKKEIKNQIEKSWKVIEESISMAKKNNLVVEQKFMRIDSHVHTHMLPIVWEALTEVIDENDYKVEYIRNSKEPLLPFIKSGEYSLVNLIKNIILNIFSFKVDSYCNDNSISQMYLWGLSMSGKMFYEGIEETYDSFMEYAKKNNRTVEILFHPGFANVDEKAEEMNDKNFLSFNSNLNRRKEKETMIKLSERIKYEE